jgi:hypothetical protein
VKSNSFTESALLMCRAEVSKPIVFLCHEAWHAGICSFVVALMQDASCPAAPVAAIPLQHAGRTGAAVDGTQAYYCAYFPKEKGALLNNTPFSLTSPHFGAAPLLLRHPG